MTEFAGNSLRDTIAPPRGEQERSAGLAAAFLEALPFPALAIGRGGGVLMANGAAQSTFLKSVRSLEAHGLSGLLSEDSPVYELVARAWHSGAPVSGRDMMVRGPSFGEIACDVTAAPSDEGGFVAVILRPRGRGRDLAERLHDSAGARSMAAIGRTLAHEIKNPLAGIRGAAQLLVRDADPGELQLVNLIVEETDRVRRLIDRMESFGNEAPINFQKINVHASLERVAVLIENSFGNTVTIKRRFDPSIPDALGDEDQLMQVFLNLAKNAAEATAGRVDGAEIALSTAYRHGVRVRTPAGDTQDLPLEIAFLDNGRGVSEALRDCLFEPFVTTKTTSGGLGLPLVQKIVSAHGGVIDFESEPGKTIFRVRLPISHIPSSPSLGKSL
jgi:two-component system, NtrC family, nitrogen regulation sensor histidine kinase GlnL